MGGSCSNGHIRAARKILQRSMPVVLAALIVVTGTPGGLLPAAAAAGKVSWDSQADFETNASSIEDTTTISGVSTQRVPGSVMLSGPIVSMAAGDYHTVGLKSDGTVVAVGRNDFGQTNVSGWTDIVSAAAAELHTVGLKSDGTVVAVGSNGAGQKNVSGWTDIVSIAAGRNHTVGLESSGTVLAVGDNTYGQTNTSSWTDIVAVSAGVYHTVGLGSDGTVVAVGDNSVGQIEVSTWTDIVAVSAGYWHTVGLKSDGTIVAVGAGTDGQTDVSTWSDIVSVAGGGLHTVALKSDGTVVAVGDNTYGQTNTSSWTDIVAVSAGVYHTVGLRSDGTVVAVGDNTHGQTNISAWTDIVAVAAGTEHSVGLKSDGTVAAVGWGAFGQTNTSSWTDIVSVTAGGYHTVGLKSDGTVVAVGGNDDGQTETSIWTDIVAVAAGNWHTVGLKSDGTAVAVGGNDDGQTETSAWTDIVSVEAGFFHTVGLKADGTVVAAGSNSSGQTETSTWTDIVSVAAGGAHTVGLKSDGTVVGVGSNAFGQTNVSTWSDIISVAAGYNHTVGLKSDGTVVGVGSNTYGQTNVSTWSDIISVAAGSLHTVALESDGSVTAVGYNEWNQMDTSGWVSITDADPRTGSIGGSGPAVGLRAEVPSGLRGWTTIDAVTSALRPFQAVKFAVRLSDDGVTWSEPYGFDGNAIDWTSGSGNYLGRAVTDPSARTDLSALPASAYIDIVVRLESAGTLTPELKSVTLGCQLNEVAIAGNTRFSTAVAASLEAYPDGLDPTGAKTVVIATARNWPDALGGSSLAGVLDGPILLVDTNSVPDVVSEEITRLNAEKAIILGGTAAVGLDVEEALKTLLGNTNVDRIAGAGRYETADAVAARVIELADPPFDGTAFVATGAKFPDALAAAPLAAANGWPLYLAHPLTGLSAATKAAMGDVDTVLVLGGTAGVSSDVETYLNGAHGEANVTRLSGADRYETAVKVATYGVDHGGLGWNRVAIATGANFPDALAGGVLQGKVGSVMLLTRPEALNTYTKTALTSHKTDVRTVTFFGGTGALPQIVRDQVSAALE